MYGFIHLGSCRKIGGGFLDGQKEEKNGVPKGI